MNVETRTVHLKEIHKNDENPRKIDKKELERLKKSLKDFPEMMSMREIIVDETMTILGGNMRYLALKELNEKTAIVKIVRGLTENQKREFIIKDNSNFGDWDFDELVKEWSDLPLDDWGIDLPEEWLKPEIEVADDDFDVDGEDVEPVCKLGEIWKLGEHRLLCGDATIEKNRVRNRVRHRRNA